MLGNHLLKLSTNAVQHLCCSFIYLDLLKPLSTLRNQLSHGFKHHIDHREVNLPHNMQVRLFW